MKTACSRSKRSLRRERRDNLAPIHAHFPGDSSANKGEHSRACKGSDLRDNEDYLESRLSGEIDLLRILALPPGL